MARKKKVEFYGAFSSRADAEREKRQHSGAIIKTIRVRGQRRFSVMKRLAVVLTLGLSAFSGRAYAAGAWVLPAAGDPLPTVAWDPSPTPWVEGYHVYRSDSPEWAGGGFSKIGSTGSTAPLEFRDGTFPRDGRRRYFAVTAFGAFAESPPSNVVPFAEAVEPPTGARIKGAP